MDKEKNHRRFYGPVPPPIGVLFLLFLKITDIARKNCRRSRFVCSKWLIVKTMYLTISCKVYASLYKRIRKYQSYFPIIKWKKTKKNYWKFPDRMIRPISLKIENKHFRKIRVFLGHKFNGNWAQNLKISNKKFKCPNR